MPPHKKRPWFLDNIRVNGGERAYEIWKFMQIENLIFLSRASHEIFPIEFEFTGCAHVSEQKEHQVKANLKPYFLIFQRPCTEFPN